MSNPLEQIISTLSPEKRAILAEKLRPAPEPIAIVGLGCRFPGGSATPEAFWRLLRDGADAIVEVPADRWDSQRYYDPDPATPDKTYTRWGGFVPELGSFDAQFFGISPGEALRMDPQQRLLLECAWEALESAGIAVDTLAGSPTGVYVGIIHDSYTTMQIEREGLSRCLNDPYFSTGSSSSMAAGRLAYLFDLRGPNLTLDTACSSSLVATHLACQSLRARETDLALVGGVNAILMPDLFISLCKMHMLSQDGRCKTFDAAADGFVVGEGCGMLALKRLSDAQRDGNPIVAVIRGSAVNEDGRSSSPTAPNGMAQQDVIRRALAAAGVAPQQIAYVEAHGSGTALGDPIEIEALGAVLGKGRAPDQRLAVGAVKTNIGHLAAAAGVAGVIKTALAIQHGQIPPHLNLRDRNPGIPWDAAPIDVPTRLTPWPAGAGPRLAGVSSFGWAGTNAHLVLEQAPAPQPSGPSRPHQLLLLSARTPAALDAAAARLREALQSQPELELADVAHTLRVGRRAFEQRRALVARDREEALALLADAPPARVWTSTQKPAARSVAFLLPGVGEHYPGMARELYEREPAFKTALDQCCDLLQPLLGQDLRPLLFPAETAAASNGSGAGSLRALLGRAPQSGAEAGPLHQTALAQPAVFAIEYALAQLLASWGVLPSALLGYSLGEYVAACLAGVISLEDALRLVATRAKLIQALPNGVMLAVQAGADALQPFLGEGVELAATNTPGMSVLAGPEGAIAAAEARLTEAEIACRRLATSHAFHSQMLAPVAAELTALARTLKLSPPRTPYLSNVTGAWVTAAEATDPAYWARHMVQTVRFGEAVATLLAQSDQAVLEVGPGAGLTALVRQHPACGRERLGLIVPTLPAQHEAQDTQAALLGALGKLWLAGVTPDWQAFSGGEQRRRVPLPTYPFERQRFWIDPVAPSAAQLAAQTAAQQPRFQTHDDLLNVPRAELEEWFFVPSWSQAAGRRPAAPAPQAEGRCWLLFADSLGLAEELARWLEDHGQTSVLVRPGSGFAQAGPRSYQVAPAERADYDALLRALHRDGHQPERIVHAWNVGADGSASPETAQEYSFYSLLVLGQALGDLELEQGRLWVLTSAAQQVAGDEPLDPFKVLSIGPCRSIQFENTAVTSHSIDLRAEELEGRGRARLVELLLGELTAEDGPMVTALRAGRRWTQRMEQLTLGPAPEQELPLRERGVYLITGGLGGIGLSLAEHLARTLKARLVLLGRQALPEREAWAGILAEQPESDQARRIAGVQALEAHGAEVLALAVDVTDEASLGAAVRQTLTRFGALHGVLHAAGVPGVGLLALKTREQAASVLAPKVQGTLALTAALRDVPLDFLVLFSSVAAASGGGAGQVDYCAANAFLDAYAQAHPDAHGMTISVGWGEWEWNGWDQAMSGYDPATQEFFRERRRRYGMTYSEGAESLRRVLAQRLPLIYVSTQDLQQLVTLTERGSTASFVPAEPDRPRFARPNLGTSYVAPRNELETLIAGIWSEQLGIDQIGINDNFFDLGGNSLVGLALLTKLRKQLGIDHIPSYVLYEAPSVSAMARFFNQDRPQTAQVEDRLDRGAKRRERQAQRKRGQ